MGENYKEVPFFRYYSQEDKPTRSPAKKAGNTLQAGYLTKALAIPPSTLIMLPVDLSRIATSENTPFAISSG